MSRVAVVTGGASGIGLGVARRFVADGHPVAILDRNGRGAEAAAADLRAQGAKVIAVEVDVADRPSVTSGRERVRTELGPDRDPGHQRRDRVLHAGARHHAQRGGTGSSP